MLLQPDATGSGAGRKLSIGAGPGAISGTDKTGDIDILLGPRPAAGERAKLRFMGGAAGATLLGQFQEQHSDWLQLTTPVGFIFSSNGSVEFVSNAGTMLMRAPLLTLGFARTSHCTDLNVNDIAKEVYFAAVTVATAATTTIATYALPVTRYGRCEVRVSWGNVTLATGGSAARAATFVRDGSNHSQLQSTYVLGVDDDASDPGVVITLSVVSNNMAVQAITADGDTRKFVTEFTWIQRPTV
jgi:hypothetical protein